MKLLLAFIFGLMINVPTSQAKNTPALGGGNKAPIEISADKTLEWHQEDKQYIANGNAIAKQGNFSIKAEILVADYRDDNEGGNVEIWRLTATQNVYIQNGDSNATGDKAVYNIDTGIATLTGSNLKLTTPDQKITAQSKIEYNTTKETAKAVGNAQITRGKETLKANNIHATFAKDSTGKQVLKTATANGNVTITTPSETLSGDHGVYNAQNNTAEITGHVKIIRGPNTLEGARAEVDLTTNVSKIFGEGNGGKRVKAVFFPENGKP